ncbi:hypothetical protein ATK78_2806 [Pedobacter metabolipauper]|uniref:Uncharacterized protein n=2 Tax=Pedobacter metabolipauper TaxID=425513 RepID=A0A4R6SSM2_9SPHI|nr:hypothetical protein ATK78_2806 [Pedobacter metabolipauper]
MTGYWILINYAEFKDRVAGWSTFSSAEVWYYVFVTTALSLVISLLIFSVMLYMIINRLGNENSIHKLN